MAQAPRSSSRASGLPSQGADRENVAAGRLRRPGSQERGAGDAGGAEGDVGRGAGEELAPADQQGPVLEPRHHLLLLLPRRRRDGAEVIGGYRHAAATRHLMRRRRKRERGHHDQPRQRHVGKATLNSRGPPSARPPCVDKLEY